MKLDQMHNSNENQGPLSKIKIKRQQLYIQHTVWLAGDITYQISYDVHVCLQNRFRKFLTENTLKETDNQTLL